MRIKESSKKLLTAENKQSFPHYVDEKKPANEFAKFFMTKVDDIHIEIDSIRIPVIKTHGNISLSVEQRLESFRPLTEGDVLVLIQKLAKKSCMLDPIPTSIVTECLDVLLSEI